MNQNDYVILFDEKGIPYIAHAGWLDNARNAARNAANAVSNTAQQVANRAKGVGRGVRTNHKYILKVNENGKTRYFYKQEEVQAYYEAKRKGIKNPAEYAQKAADAASNAVDAVKNTASRAGNAARNAFREVTGQAARDRMDEAAAKYPELETNYRNAKQAYQDADTEHRRAAEKLRNSTAEVAKATRELNNSNIFNRKQRQTNYDTAKAQQEQYERAASDALKKVKSTQDAYNKAEQEAFANQLQGRLGEFAYDKSLAGAVDRTAARAREVASDVREATSSAYNKAKDAANNTVSNAKNAYERMKGEFRDRAEQAGNAVKSTAKNAVDKAKDIAGYDEKERFDKATENRQSAKDAARKGEQYVTDVLDEASPLSRTKEQNQRLNAAVDIRNERWNAEDKARDEYWRARADYNKTPLAMVNRAKDAASSVVDSVRDTAKDASNAVKNAASSVVDSVRDTTKNAANAVKSTAKNAVDKARDIAGYDERERRDSAHEYALGLASKGELTKAASDQLEETNRQYDKTPLGMIENAKEAISDAKYLGQKTINNARNSVKSAVQDVADKSGITARKNMTEAQKLADELYSKGDGLGSFNAASMAKLAEQIYHDTPLGRVEKIPKQVKEFAEEVKAVKNLPQLRQSVADYEKQVEDVRKRAREYQNEFDEYHEPEMGRKAKEEKEVAAIMNAYLKSYKEGLQEVEDAATRAKAPLVNAKSSVTNAVQGMIDNARSSTAKAVNEAWEKIPKNADGTVNPFDPNFQSTYNNWKNRKDKYDNSLTGRAKEAAERATDSVMDMIDQAKKAAKNTATSAQEAIDNATGNNYRKRAQEANQAAENAINQRARTSDQLENQRSKYGSKTNDSDHIYGDSEGYYYKTKEQRDRAESLISKRDRYDADIVNNNRASKVNDSMYADSKAGRINSLLGREISSTSERSNSKATEVNDKWDRQEAESKLIGGRLDPGINVSKEYVYSRASNSGMAGEVRQVKQLEEAMRSAERAYERLSEDSSKPQSSSKAARQKMLQAQDAYEKAYEELIDDINDQYDRDLAEYERRYGKYNRG